MPQTDPDASPQLVPARILVVEDEPLVRFDIAEALRELGVSVVEAANADEAWEYISAGSSVDLVFTDHRMPGSMTGAQLATRIRREYPTVRIIVTSGHFDTQEWSDPVLMKPYALEETGTRLARLALQNKQNGENP